MSLLSVKNLKVKFQTNDGVVHAVNDLSFDIGRKEKLALVGESGSGKSQIAFSILGLLAGNGRAEGEILFNGTDLLKLSNAEMNKVRAKQISIIFQDPMSSLNPYMRIDKQLTEVLHKHENISNDAANKRALDYMDAVKIPDAKSRFRAYPHELSGGMRQRVVIAMALLCNPQLIIADEPTTALDVTVQAQIMGLLDDIADEFDTSFLLITHDLGVVSDFCDEILVLYGGRQMERAKTASLFENPTHPYTRGLLRAVPNIHSDSERLYAIPGTPPSALGAQTSCPFSNRCSDAIDACFSTLPELTKQTPYRACLRDVTELSK